MLRVRKSRETDCISPIIDAFPWPNYIAPGPDYSYPTLLTIVSAQIYYCKHSLNKSYFDDARFRYNRRILSFGASLLAGGAPPDSRVAFWCLDLWRMERPQIQDYLKWAELIWASHLRSDSDHLPELAARYEDHWYMGDMDRELEGPYQQGGCNSEVTEPFCFFSRISPRKISSDAEAFNLIINEARIPHFSRWTLRCQLT